jgi:hypothetical protein
MKRWVQFWQLLDPNYEPLPGPFPARRVCNLLKKARDTDNHVLYHWERDSYKALVDPVCTDKNNVAHISLSRLRSTDLPAEEHGGRLQDLSITNNSNLAEETHFIFLKRNVVGVVYNHFGPRATRLPTTLNDMFSSLDVRILPVYRSDILATLGALEEIVKLETAIKRDNVQYLTKQTRPERQLAEALEALAEASPDGYVRGTWQSCGVKAPALQRWFADIANSLANGRNLGAMKLAKVYGKAEGDKVARPIDLINEHLVTQQEFQRRGARGRQIDSVSAEKNVLQAQRHHADDLNAAVNDIGNATIPVGQFQLQHDPEDDESDDAQGGA